ncbi:MAG: hypothetical protein ACYDGR_04465 [Candidatus Dormibacteria bacterium]
MAVFALPSALNLPQANPGQTLEYAPVPGDQGQVSAGGNVASLGLGNGDSGPTTGIGGGSSGGGSEPPPPLTLPVGAGGAPSTKQCVGNPPRQTEDLASPPCVAFFHGDNGGSTYQGVSGSEFRIVVYLTGGWCWLNTGAGAQECEPKNTYVDLEQPPTSNEITLVAQLRNWQAYFNARYQTYGRHVHFYVYFGQGTGSPEAIRAAAADNNQRLHPFAALSYNNDGNNDVYSESMAQLGVLNFGASDLRSDDTYQKFPRLLWGFYPTVETIARMYSTFVCSKVAPYPASFSGNAGENQQSRVYGLLSTTDPRHPELVKMAKLVRDHIEACGITLKETATFPYAGFVNVTASYQSSDEVQGMAKFKKSGVTTIIWAGGFDPGESKAAASLGYIPEWIYAGDLVGDGNISASFQDSTEWAHAWTVTPITLQGAQGEPVEPACFNAYIGMDPNVQRSTTDIIHACLFYDDLRQLFTGAQVAGPRLTPQTIDQGFRAIPARASTGPQVPACFYRPSDYTCVKDAVAEWWDSSAPAGGSPNGNGSYIGQSSSGCWRMAEYGARHQVGQWSPGPVLAQQDLQHNPCNLWTGILNLE